MLNPIASFCVFLVEVVIAYIFFSNLFDHRIEPVKCLIVGVGLAFCASALNLLSQNNPSVNGLSTIGITIILSFVCFRCTVIQSVFHTAILVVVNTALETFVVAVSAHVTGSGFQDYNNSFFLFIFQAITCKTLYYLCTLILARAISHSPESVRVPWSFLLYPLICTFCDFIFWRVCSQPETSYEVRLLLAVASGLLFVSSIFLFVTYYHHVGKEQESMRVKNELLRLQTEESYYRILDEQNQQLLIYAHDARKHLSAIEALTDDRRINSYVAQLSRQLQEYARHCHSGNKLLDVMIYKYETACSLHGITLEYDVKLCNLSGIEDLDLVAILGNLMDNAIRAAEESAEKTIRLETARRNVYSVIVVTNSCDTPPRHAGEHLISTKLQPGVHGFGLKSVRQALKKYQGDLDWGYDEDAHSFTVTVMVDELTHKAAERI